MKILSVFGTRPEAIKMAPLVKAIEKDPELQSVVCVTAQHRQMLDMVLELFDIKPDYDLNIMSHGQGLVDIIAKAMTGLDQVIKKEKPDIVLVHGDTTTTLAGAQAAFYNGVKVGHVEAGLRSGNRLSPFPEEINRTLAGILADVHFSPTRGNVNNLLKEGVNEDRILITGNTVIDALFEVIDENFVFNNETLDRINFNQKKVILLTCHRRENWGKPMEDIFEAVKDIVTLNDDVEIIFPMHLNPKVREIAYRVFKDIKGIHLIEPLDYLPFANLLNKCYLVLTDSGGIQEEAPALGKPVVVLRTETERPEAVDAGTVVIAGVEKDSVFNTVDNLLKNENAYKKMANAINPYGDGQASKRIVNYLKGLQR